MLTIFDIFSPKVGGISYRSSNKVEKANDMLVSSRQKGDSMSWSREGSWALANVTAMYLNHEDEAFHTVHKLAYHMYRNYGNVFDLKLTA